MNKTILINIQIDGVTSKDLAIVEELIEECLKEYRQINFNYNITDQLGQGLPIRQNGNN